MSTQVFVGNIPFSFTDDNLKELFTPAGEIESVQIVRQGPHRSKGFGFVTFANEEAATKSVDLFNGKEHDGRKMRVETARTDGKSAKASSESGEGADGEASGSARRSGRGGRRGGRSGRGGRRPRGERVPAQPRIELNHGIFVANIPFAYTEDKLKEVFAEFKPTNARVVRNPYGHSRGYGFIDLETPELQQAAVDAMFEKEIEGRTITVKIANTEDAAAKEDETPAEDGKAPADAEPKAEE